MPGNTKGEPRHRRDSNSEHVASSDPRQGGSMTQLFAAGEPSPNAVSTPQAARVVQALNERAEELVVDLTLFVMAAPKLSDSAWMPPPVEAGAESVANLRSLLSSAQIPSLFDPDLAR